MRQTVDKGGVSPADLPSRVSLLLPSSPDRRSRVLMVTHYIPFLVTCTSATDTADTPSPPPAIHLATSLSTHSHQPSPHTPRQAPRSPFSGIGSPSGGTSSTGNGGSAKKPSAFPARRSPNASRPFMSGGLPSIHALNPFDSLSTVADSADSLAVIDDDSRHSGSASAMRRPESPSVILEEKEMDGEAPVASGSPPMPQAATTAQIVGGTAPSPRATTPLTNSNAPRITTTTIDGDTSTSHPSSSASTLRWHFHPRRDHSALYAGLVSAQELADCIYIGCLDHVYTADGQRLDAYTLSEEDKEGLKKALWEEKRCVPVFNEPYVSFGHYDGFCKQGLWPLFHYILWEPTAGRNEANYWAAYIQLNQSIVDTIAAVFLPGDAVWVHDYHFMLVPAMARKAVPTAVIGFFLHTPFPSSEIFRCLPQRKEVLKGLLGANLLGFQTYSYARHFISSCTRVLGVESTPKGVEYRGFHVAIGIFPIGVDVEQVQKQRLRTEVQEKIQALRELYPGKKLIVGRDKLDQIKSTEHRLAAFEKFLNEYPEWQDKVVLIQVTSPAEFGTSKQETRVSELVSHINGHYGTLEFAPVHHYHHRIDKDEYYALLTIADLALITSTRDGMNTSSHEYVVCQQENHGPLILSEFTGTAGSLSAALLVNPWDTRGVAAAIHECLTMSKEDKLIKHQQLYRYVTMNTASFWATSFIREMQFVARIPDQANPTPYLDTQMVVDKFKASKKRIFFLDYDGTLTPIRKTPNAAVPPEAMLHALQRLTKDPSVFVYVISGRDQAALDMWLGHIEHLGMSAEHGCYIKNPKSEEWINLAEEMDLSWKNDVLPIFEYYTERTPGSFIEQKQSSLTWHYRLADPDFGSWQAKECHNHLENAVLSKLPVEILLGKKNLEVRPQHVNKGEIVKRLLTQNKDADFIFCAGDDKTDEDMFRALRGAAAATTSGIGAAATSDNSTVVVDVPAAPTYISCTLGTATKKTQAQWHVGEPLELINVLVMLADALDAEKENEKVGV